MARVVLGLLGLCLLGSSACAQAGGNLLPDPSIEASRERDRFGIPFAQWGGWIFEGAPEFRNGLLARGGATCAELVGAEGGKLRLYSPSLTLEPGRYRFSCYLRGLDVGTHAWGLSEDVCFADEQYYPLRRSGTFGWTRLELVKDIPARQEAVARVGLWAGGRLWVDDAEIVRVADDTPLGDGPTLGEEEAPVAPPGALDPARAARCPECGYRNMPEWGHCYACGEPLGAEVADEELPAVRQLASFEEGTVAPFTPAAGDAVAEHASDGRFALRLDREYIVWDGPQDWTGYDFVTCEAFNGSASPADLYIEVRDAATTDYWTRVNYNTVLPPGASTLIVPTDLYVGEKSRPGRALDKVHVTRFVFSIGEASAPVWFDNLRLTRDLSDSVQAPGLQAFSFGPGGAPPLRGFTQVTPSTSYSPGRGYGLRDARIWRAFDVLQPDPLYRTFVCIEAGGFAVDLPDGRYHVFLNLDSPSGFWGEYQTYRERVVRANGVEVVRDTMDLARFRERYFRFAETDDSPDSNTFDKYQDAYFEEKEFDVAVTGGQLLLEFEGANWANCLSTVVVYPLEEAEAGREWLANLRERRRFHFDNYFKRVLPDPRRDGRETVPEFVPTAEEERDGYVLFARDWMRDVSANALPRREEVTTRLAAFASAGELEPIVFSLHPIRDLGMVSLSVGDLVAADGARIPAEAIRAGVVSHRLSRLTMEGTVYTIAPRYVMPRDSAEIREGTTTTFWLTLQVPRDVAAGEYRGSVQLRFASGEERSLELLVRAFATPLDEVDIPVGPWGSTIDLPWYAEDLGDLPRETFRACLAKMRDYGVTSFSGIPTIRIRGWSEGKPDIDFAQADWQMSEARAAGFSRVVINYNGGIQGFDNYFIDESAMRAAGFTSYVDFLRVVLAAVDSHAREAGWLPVAYNLCDEPLGEALPRAAENARAWREAAPPTLLTTGATSVESPAADDPHLALARALRIADLNGHDEAAIEAIHAAGSEWAFYNGGNRWTFGTYMRKCARDYGMRYRLSWHWNAAAGDPFYALDCREDDYAWCVANARGELIPTVHFERDVREGLDDYRYLLTLERLLGEKPDHPFAARAREIVESKLASFALGERDHDARWPSEEYASFRLSLAEAIERMARQ